MSGHLIKFCRTRIANTGGGQMQGNHLSEDIIHYEVRLVTHDVLVNHEIMYMA